MDRSRFAFHAVQRAIHIAGYSNRFNDFGSHRRAHCYLSAKTRKFRMQKALRKCGAYLKITRWTKTLLLTTEDLKKFVEVILYMY